MTVQPFTINVPQAVLDDLQSRLQSTRWADDAEGSGWDYGVDAEYLKSYVNYWQNEYNWREQEASLNALPQFRAEIDGVGIHFIHVRGKGPNPTPIILTHGWPDSFYRFHKVIPMLTDPASFGGDVNVSFDMVVPSIPGFGFSDRVPMSEERVADLWVKLMRELGYESFAAAGGDVGAIITKALGYKYPEVVTAVHLTDVGYPGPDTDFASLSPAEMEFAGFIEGWWMQNGAYAMLQMTKPQTLAYALNDSPVGMAAWMMNLIGGDIEKRISRDDLITNTMIYWVSQTIGSSIRSYRESAQAQALIPAGEKVEVPTAVAHAKLDAPLPREWAERQVNLKHYSELDAGHFAAWEAPEAFARDLQDFMRELHAVS